MTAANGTALAQAPAVARYPWDQRPNKCFMPGAEPIGMCAPVDNWPSVEKTGHYIGNLFFNETYGLLERYLTDLVASKKRFPDGAYPEEAIVLAFARLMPGVVDDGRGAQGIAAWRKAAPDSHFPVLAEAALARAAAWNARGSGYAHTVSPQAWELFAIRLQEAEQVLLKAPAALKESPAWHLSLLAIALDSDRVQSRPQPVFDAAVKRWPTYARFYYLMASRMVPKWGGSWAQVESFIGAASARQPASEGKSLYARLYVSLASDGAAYESSADWQTLKAGFEDAIARFSDPKYKNLYASYACLAKDRSAFSQAMSTISREELIPAWWLNGHSYDSCMRWAGV